MTNVIAMPRHKRVVVDYGVVTETRTTGAHGTTVVRHRPPELRFFVDVYDGDGGRDGVFDSLSYGEALAAAHEWLADGYKLEDRVAASARQP